MTQEDFDSLVRLRTVARQGLAKIPDASLMQELFVATLAGIVAEDAEGLYKPYTILDILISRHEA